MPPPSQYKNQHQCDHCIACSCSHLCWTSGSFSISSPNTPPDRGCTSISSVAHAMVQERLDQMINERKEARRRRDETSKFVVIVAMEKASDDPRQDFRESIVEVIERNRIMRPRDLRRLLECYLSVNSDEYRGDILDVFHKGSDLLVKEYILRWLTRSRWLELQLSKNVPVIWGGCGDPCMVKVPNQGMRFRSGQKY